MFRIHQVSVVLRNGRQSIQCLVSKYQNSGSSWTQSYISKKFMSSKDDKRIPSIKECPTPSAMSEMPKPQGSWKEYEESNKKRGRTVLILGLIVTAVTLGTLYYTVLRDNYDDTKVTKKKIRKVTPKRRRVIFKDPEHKDDLPDEIQYLLIGGGTASFSAFRAIKSSDPTAKVLVVTEEPNYPYMRPPLSKEMWFGEDPEKVKQLMFKQWNGSERSLFYEPEVFYTPCNQLKSSTHGGVSVARGWTVTRIDAKERKAYLEGDKAIKYEKCLIATGASPRLPPVFENALQDEHLCHKVKLYRNINDFEDVYKDFKNAKNIVIVGGGFLGSELACALGRISRDDPDKTVTQVFRESGNMGKILPEYLSLWTTSMVEGEGVQVVPSTDIIGLKDNQHGGIELKLKDHTHIEANMVIVSCGVEPNTKLAQQSDLEVDPELGGFLVNSELQARSDLYVAGDCGCFYDPMLGRRRIEHHDHAVVSGRLAGENMTGARKPYTHQSMFWSDLGPEVGYEAIGIVDSRLPTVGVFAKGDEECIRAEQKTLEQGEHEAMEEERSALEECEPHMTEAQKKELEIEVRHEIQKEEEKEDFGKGVIFYLRNDIVVGIVLWNVFNRMSIARQVLKDRKKYDDLNEVAKLFNIHDDEIHAVESKDTSVPEK